MTADLDFNNPFESPEAWDTLVLGGVTFRGEFEWGGDVVKAKADRRRARGRSGTTVRSTGYDLAELSLSLTCYAPEHFQDLTALFAVVFPRTGETTRRAALTCTHPVLTLAGITQVYGESATALRQASPTKWTCELKLIEYRPPVPGARNVAHRVTAVPDIGANRTAITGLEQAPTTTPTPPSTTDTDPDD